MAYNNYNKPNKKTYNNQDRTSYQLNKDKSFVNPYNFVRPDFNINRDSSPESTDKNPKETFTEKLHCEMYINTPIAILDTESVIDDYEKKGHKKYSFFNIDMEGQKVLAIPGSSIRGCVRSMYETLTNSCFATLSEKAFLSTRVSTNDVYKPGILIKENNNWCLYSADRKALDTKNKDFKLCNDEGLKKINYRNKLYSNGEYVEAEVCEKEVVSIRKAQATTNYVLYIGEPFGKKKHNESLFEKQTIIAVNPEALTKAINGLEYSIKMYRNKSINRNLGSGVGQHGGYQNYDQAKAKGVIPVWYKKRGNDNISLSMAAIGRKVYQKTINDLVRHGFVACMSEAENRKATLCPACSLFGTEKGMGFGSRIRFSDAILTDDMGQKPISVTLQELGTPRTGYLPFYALNGLDYDAAGANINGRKFYWHNPKAAGDPATYTTEVKNERNATVDIIKKGKFEFDIYLDNVTAEQIKLIKWVLTLGENTSDSKYCYKIGHGKPLGLGSVKICVTKEERRSFSSKGYLIDNIEVEVPSDVPGINKSVLEQVKKITDYTLLDGYDIRYPYVELAVDVPSDKKLKENVLANHKWFSESKGVRKGEKTITLAPLTSDNYELHPYEIKHISKRDFR